ncbi:MAG: hypothetical protein WA151_22840, partial [Desulfatirhabdiaceae bacterium]
RRSFFSLLDFMKSKNLRMSVNQFNSLVQNFYKNRILGPVIVYPRSGSRWKNAGAIGAAR